MKPQEATLAIKDILSQCNSDDDFRVAMYFIIEFMLISDLSIKDIISCIENAGGDYIESDRCIDDMIAELKDNYL